MDRTDTSYYFFMARINFGQVIIMEINVIYTGDCIKILNEKIDEKSVELIFADPPYNLSGNNLKWKGNKTGGDWYMVNEEWDKMTTLEYSQFTDNWVTGCHRVLKDNGSIYVSCTYHNIAEIMTALKRLGFKINNIIVWQKTNAMPNMTKRVFTHSTEFVVWAVKGKNWIFNYEELKIINPEKQKDGSLKQMRDVWPLPLVQGKERLKGKDGRALHPTQKPEEILKRIITASSNKGDTVLDPFLGSGTTAFIAKKLERNWIGIEKIKRYVDIATRRIENIVET
jgi:site-specific DNA-methyltransferase (adenine-specific)/modification methylase